MYSTHKSSTPPSSIPQRSSPRGKPQLSILLHNLPIHAIPPIPQILLLPPEPVIPQPNMLPRIHPQANLNIRPARRQLRSGPTQWAMTPRPQRRVRILLLPPIMRPRQRTARYIRRQQRELRLRAAGDPVAAFDEPDVAGAEHGVRGGDHGRAEGFDAAEGLGEEVGEVLRKGGGVGGEGGEELVVGPGGGGVVEERGGGGVPCCGEEDVFRQAGFVGRAGCHFVEAGEDVALVGGPGVGVGGGGEHITDAMVSVVLVVG